MHSLFLLSLVLVVYAYAGYPVALWCLTIIKRGPKIQENPSWLPKVSLLISVYNEEAILEEKIRNSLSLDYPRELLEIVVISDGSTDQTEEIAKRFVHQGIVLKSYPGRIGKTACLNQVMAAISGEIIIFSDANSMYATHVVRALIEPFADPAIGYVTGGTSYVSDENGKMGESIGLYSRLERMTKLLESRIGSCVGADGAMFAIRRSLYEPLDRVDINDLVIPLRIIRGGFRGVYTPSALCVEVASKEATHEFRRQVRIAARTIRAVMTHRALLNPFRYGIFAFQFMSHKFCKLVVPFLLLSTLISNAALMGAGTFYLVTLVLQLMVYGTALIAMRSAIPHQSGSAVQRLLDVVHSFILVNVAVAVAWVRYWKGESFTTWAPAR
jgi:cellulose synthase/poly-beta-1,6-N-acetylglucosamine synthase-like glycosyltransferase